MESARQKQEQQQEIDHHQTLALDLYDLYWFRYLILSRLPPPPPPPPPDVESRTSSPPQTLLRRRSIHRRSLSEDLCPSPTFQIRTPKLETILSGKESAISDETSIDDENRRWRRKNIDLLRRRRRRPRGETSKSMSELEFEELKGFMDLGFTFSDADKDPRLMEIVPGLQRLKGESAGAVDEDASSSASADDVAVSRPYLSEAWDAVEEEDEERRLRNLRVPLMVGNGVDLKDQLKYWAHAVASTVR